MKARGGVGPVCPLVPRSLAETPSAFAVMSHRRAEAPSGEHRGEHSFRRLDKKKITAILRDQGIPVSPDFFDAPKKKDVLAFIRSLLHLVFGLNLELSSAAELKTFVAQHILTKNGPARTSSCKDGLAPDCDGFNINFYLPDRGERHLSAICILILLRYMQCFGEMCSLTDISLNDIIRPTSERMILFASAVCDYILFQEANIKGTLSKWSELELIYEDINNIRDQTEKYQCLKRSFAAEKCQSEYEKLKKAESETHALLAELGQRAEQLAIERDQDASKRKNLEDLIKEQESQVSAYEKEIRLLQAEIVQTPEKAFESLETLKREIRVVDKSLSLRRETLPRVELKATVMSTLLGKMEEGKALMEISASFCQRVTGLREISGRLGSKLKDTEAYLSELAAEEARLRKEFDDASHELIRCRDEVSLEERKQDAEKERLRERLALAEQVNREKTIENIDLNNKISSLEKEIESLKAAQAQIAEQAAHIYSNLLSTILEDDVEPVVESLTSTSSSFAAIDHVGDALSSFIQALEAKRETLALLREPALNPEGLPSPGSQR